jgi:septal ring-binding cell division protein DamX
MRFEIKTGGILAILIGIGMLSGAVFLLGVWAGYGVGLESQVSTAQVATAYPLTPQAGESSPGAASSEVGSAEGESSPEAAASTPGGESATPPAPVAAATEARAMPKPYAHATPLKRTAAAEAPPPAETNLPPAESPETGNAAPEAAGTPAARENTASIGNSASSERTALPAPRYRRRPYNIQIEAAMDRNGATSMAQRLQRLGYTPHLVPTLIAGQTWYKVEVGPYATQDEAAAAQEQLRQKYNSAYGGGNDATKAAGAGGGDATQPSGAGGGSDDSGTVANPSAVANPSD